VRLSKLYYAWWMQQPVETLSDARLKHMIHRQQAGRSVNCHGYIASIAVVNNHVASYSSETVVWRCLWLLAVHHCWHLGGHDDSRRMEMDGAAMVSRQDDAISGYECNVSTSLQTLP